MSTVKNDPDPRLYVQPHSKIYNFSCTFFLKKNTTKYTTLDVLTSSFFWL